MKRLPLHLRLVAGFAAAMLLLLTGAGAFVYWRVEYALDRALDTELTHAAATITPLIGQEGLRAAAAATGADWQVLTREGTVTAYGGPAGATPIVSPDELRPDATIDVGPLWLPSATRPLRVRTIALPDGEWLVIAVRRGHRDEALRELLGQLLLAGLGSLGVATLVGSVLARAALRPVERYRAGAAEIAAGRSGLRLEVPVGRDDEVTRLGHTLNDMLTAQASALERERRFVQDASHELRTPLTLLKARIQLARSRPRDVSFHEGVLAELETDVERLASLSEQLLDQAVPAASNGAVDLAAVARAIVDARSTEGVTAAAPDTAVAAGLDSRVASRILTNLLDNALAHGALPVVVNVEQHHAHVEVSVTDAGEGISPDLLATATGRFTRAPAARSRPGAGLGLALVEQLVTAAGGELRLCCGGHHTSYGVSTGLPCDHGTAMRTSVLMAAHRP